MPEYPRGQLGIGRVGRSGIESEAILVEANANEEWRGELCRVKEGLYMFANLYLGNDGLYLEQACGFLQASEVSMEDTGNMDEQFSLGRSAYQGVRRTPPTKAVNDGYTAQTDRQYRFSQYKELNRHIRYLQKTSKRSSLVILNLPDPNEEVAV